MRRLAVLGSIDRAAEFLTRAQADDGSFESVSSPTQTPFRSTATYRTTFAPSIILGAINGYMQPELLAVRVKLATWLLGQKSPHWSFNYWASDSPDYTTTPYPDDLDDTFCALIGLHGYDPSLIDATCLGNVVRLLLATEEQVGGPYRTWLAANDAPAAWRDVDVAVNSNIAGFLKLVAQPLPNITALLEQAILGKKLASPYYPSLYPLAYYLARGYEGAHKQAITHALQRRRVQGAWNTPLQTALAVSSLLQLGASASAVAPAVAFLLATQQADGSWPAEAFWMDTTFHGAAALTTALAIEALSRYDAKTHASNPSPSPVASGDHAAVSPLYSVIMTRAEQDLQHLDPSLRSQAAAMLNLMNRAENRHEIVLLPHFFRQLAPNLTPAAAQSLCMHLGLANLYGWMAYTIFDDFLDEEGKPNLLPTATLSLRRSLAHFRQALPHHSEFQTYVEQTFDAIDNANTWEVTRTRFAIIDGHVTINAIPYYRSAVSVADRSIGHALTPLAVLAAGGASLSGLQAKALYRALRYYLAARQLHDDAHDWEQDLRAGHCSYVVAELLRDLNIAAGEHALSQILPKARHRFWHHTLPKLCQTMLRLLNTSRQALRHEGLVGNVTLFLKLLDTLEESIHHTQHEQAGAEKFLRAYRDPQAPEQNS